METKGGKMMSETVGVSKESLKKRILLIIVLIGVIIIFLIYLVCSIFSIIWLITPDGFFVWGITTIDHLIFNFYFLMRGMMEDLSVLPIYVSIVLIISILMLFINSIGLIHELNQD